MFMPVASRRAPVTDSLHCDYHDNRSCGGQELPPGGGRQRRRGAGCASGPAGDNTQPSSAHREFLGAPAVLILITDSSVQPLDERGPTGTHPAQKPHDGLRLSHKLVDIEASSNERSPELTCAVRLLHISTVSPPSVRTRSALAGMVASSKEPEPKIQPVTTGQLLLSTTCKSRMSPELRWCASRGGVQG